MPRLIDDTLRSRPTYQAHCLWLRCAGAFAVGFGRKWVRPPG
jgi:hypothetical protein